MYQNKKISLTKYSSEYEKARDSDDTFLFCSQRFNKAERHYHKQIEMLFIQSGTKTISINNKDYTLTKGDFAIINPFDLHKYYKSSAKVCFVCIPIKYLHLFEQYTNGDFFEEQIIKASDKTKKIEKELFHIEDFNSVGEITKQGYILSLLGAIFDCINIKNKEHSNSCNSLKTQIIEYIDNNLTANITLDSIAKYCGFSKSHISREFNSLFNTNLNKYINTRRLKSFINLQASNDESISNNAFAVGFSSIRTFYNVFKEHYNTTPSEFFSLYHHNTDSNSID